MIYDPNALSQFFAPKTAIAQGAAMPDPGVQAMTDMQALPPGQAPMVQANPATQNVAMNMPAQPQATVPSTWDKVKSMGSAFNQKVAGMGDFSKVDPRYMQLAAFLGTMGGAIGGDTPQGRLGNAVGGMARGYLSGGIQSKEAGKIQPGMRLGANSTPAGQSGPDTFTTVEDGKGVKQTMTYSPESFAATFGGVKPPENPSRSFTPTSLAEMGLGALTPEQQLAIVQNRQAIESGAQTQTMQAVEQARKNFETLYPGISGHFVSGGRVLGYDKFGNMVDMGEAPPILQPYEGYSGTEGMQETGLYDYYGQKKIPIVSGLPQPKGTAGSGGGGEAKLGDIYLEAQKMIEDAMYSINPLTGKKSLKAVTPQTVATLNTALDEKYRPFGIKPPAKFQAMPIRRPDEDMIGTKLSGTDSRDTILYLLPNEHGGTKRELETILDTMQMMYPEYTREQLANYLRLQIEAESKAKKDTVK